MEFFERNPLDLGAVVDWPVINVKRDLCQEDGRTNRTNQVQGERKKYDTNKATTRSNGHEGRYDSDALDCSGSNAHTAQNLHP